MSDLAAQHTRRARLLVASFVAVVTVVLALIGVVAGLGVLGVAVALAVAAAAAALAWWGSTAAVLKVSRAHPADPREHARLHNLVEGLCVASGVAKPTLHVIDDEAPNAFAAGRDARHAAVAVTTGLLATLDRVELEAVLAHELSHVRTRDVLPSTLAVTLVGGPVLLADLLIRFRWWGGGRNRPGDGTGAFPPLALPGFALLAVAPVVARLLWLAVAPERESVADFAGAELTRYPPALISALEKLRDAGSVVHAGSRATAHLWIAPPIARTEEEGRLAGINRRFEARPPIDQRIAALHEL